MTSQSMTSLAATAPPIPGPESQFQLDLVALIPHLRGYSRALCGSRAVAEDMVQEALARAWRSRARFEPGTSLRAWLFTILRNEFYSLRRRSWRETTWEEGHRREIPGLRYEQESSIELADMARALRTLPDKYRKPLMLVAIGGLSYGEAASICRTRIGTIKSRVSRARAALSRGLDGDTPLPARRSRFMPTASDDILAQLSAISAVEARDTAVAHERDEKRAQLCLVER
jgi:RNA polymerase sigma-70 factor, ECF subfamily